jgi:16S rRNA (guanine527-N7)-methyltransferase
LFSRSDREKIETKHFPDAMVVLDYVTFEDGTKVLDIGTGGGIPGLVLAVMHPNVQFTLLDSTAKKMTALDEVIKELELENVKTITGRTEELAHGELRESFDVVTARALATLPTLLEYASGFIKDQGLLLAWKSRDHIDELNDSETAQELLNLTFKESFNYKIEDTSRSILVFQKIGCLDSKYPRRIGIPNKRPLNG